MSGRGRAGLALLTLACVGLAGYVVVVWPMLTREPVGPPKGELPPTVEGGREPVSYQFVGHTEPTIVERFGPPSDRCRGRFGPPRPSGDQLKYLDAITATYVRPSGVLYLTYCTERGRLVCFASAWMPEGTVF